MVVVLEGKDKRVRPSEISAQEVGKDFAAGAKPELAPGEDLAGCETRKHGDAFLGMYFDGADGKPEWGTYGVLRELPGGLTQEQVTDFLVEGKYLKLVKKLSPDLTPGQKDNLEHILGWRKRVESAVARAEPVMPKVDLAAIQPDSGIALAQTPEAGSGSPVALDNMSSLAAKRAGPGAPIEQLKKMISGAPGHVEAAELAERLHKQAGQTPEGK
ncbi:MAG: hypothetical protein M1275_00055 [Patescibacteria group bacterium]|nr:hypothetical protein [Patescibacteria group bacterium]